MTSLILQTASRLLQPLILGFSLFLLVRGHHQPGVVDPAVGVLETAGDGRLERAHAAQA